MVQSQHSIADFAAEYPIQFLNWKKESNSIISLSIRDEESLIKLYHKLQILSEVVLFTEPDIDNQATSLCVYGTKHVRKMLSNLPLSLKDRKEANIC